MNLLLTLGHNASAIWTDGVNVIGYEQERLTRHKSDSRFPIDAMEEIMKHVPSDGPDLNLFVSHWFDCKDLEKAKHGRLEKYWNVKQLKKFVKQHNFKKVKVRAVSSNFTHHDAHAWSAVEFYRQHLTEVPEGNVHIIVCDGFGNRQEVFSVYLIQPHMNIWAPALVGRAGGYSKSLGLLYQYATSFCGMKENQDEYKFLGYESHINEVLSHKELEAVNRKADEFIRPWTCAGSDAYFDYYQDTVVKKFDDFILTKDLQKTKDEFHALFADVLTCYSGGELETMEKRAVIGYFIQRVIENFYSWILKIFKIENVIVTGGVHYNVKLNHHVLKSIKGQFCAVPLAGDQGAAIGCYAYRGFRFPFRTLQWGKRDLSPIFRGNIDDELSGKYYWTNSRESYVTTVVNLLKEDQIVNTVTGWMEFGPRALCNTSTLALPTKENVDIINALNGRDTVMPFAPVVTQEKSNKLFEKSLKRVVGSLRYMIVTLDYVRGVNDQNLGVAHPYPDRKSYSGRPQVIMPGDSMPISHILREVGGGPIINTSLNVHGVPIVFSHKHAIDDLRFNIREAKKQGIKKTPVLVVGDF